MELKFNMTLKSLINQKGVSLSALAKYLNVTRQAVSYYCNGDVTPSYSLLLKIAEFFNVTTDYLLTGVQPENAKEFKGINISVNIIQLLNDLPKYCNEKDLKLIENLLGDADFYSALVHTAAMRDKEGENIINLYTMLNDENSEQDKFIIYKKLIESSNAGLSFSDLWHYLIKFINRNTSFEKATKILSDMERNFRKKEHGAIHHLI